MLMRFRLLLVLAVAFAALGGFTALAQADDAYGTGDYGNCTYAAQCPRHTIVNTPSGLQIAVNLTDGQSIPTQGYDIVVTPLNGQGSSFAKVDFYIDGILIQTVTPGTDGSATWHWDPRQYPGTKVKVVATDQSSQ